MLRYPTTDEMTYFTSGFRRLNPDVMVTDLPSTLLDENSVPIRFLFRFSNGRGASVVSHAYSPGGLDSLWELVEVEFNSRKGGWDYFLTEKVYGYLTIHEVENRLKELKNARRNR